ncbi:MAG: M48 family metallopeptidase [Eubacteriales bacterium]
MDYILRRSKRKTLVAKIEPDGKIVVCAPLWMPERQIDRFLLENQDKIARAAQRMSERKRYEPDELSQQDIKRLCDQAAEILPVKVRHYADLLGVTPTKITITGAQKRFGSCSSRGHICFSYRLMFYPEEAVDYVVVHELCHLIHMNHSKEFYQLIATVLPDWKRREKYLKGCL